MSALLALLATVPADLSKRDASTFALFQTLLAVAGLAHLTIPADAILASVIALEEGNAALRRELHIGISFAADREVAARFLARVRESLTGVGKLNGAKYALTDALASKEAKEAAYWLADTIKLLNRNAA